MAQGEHRALRALEERDTGLGQRVNDVGVEVATLLAQVAASAIGLIPGYALDPGLAPAMATVIGGVLLMLYAAGRR
jgi:ribulose kinase